MYHDEDPVADLSKADLEREVARLMGHRVPLVPSDLPRLPKLRSVKRTVLKKLPGELPDHLRPNDTISVTIDLPVYLVLGMQELTSSDRGTGNGGYREAIRDYLVARGITWWYPRFLAVNESVGVDLPDES